MNIHEEIAKERYLDMMAAGTPPADAARQAIEDATAFIYAYHTWRVAEQKKAKAFVAQSKGCPACFGSGGKKASPCATCGGTGRVYDQFVSWE